MCCDLQMHAIVDEIIFGGQVLETSSEQVMKAVEEISRCVHMIFFLLISIKYFFLLLCSINILYI